MTRKYLRQALWALRSGLARILPDGDLLRCQGDWVRASVDHRVLVDATEFEDATRLISARTPLPLSAQQAHELIRASRLYTGDLLEGWDYEWCTPPREHLRRRFLLVMDVLVSHFESTGEDSRLTGAAARVLEVDPARESAHRALIRAMIRTGDRTGAARQYRTCEAAVKEELGVAPDAETKALYEEIVRGKDRK